MEKRSINLLRRFMAALLCLAMLLPLLTMPGFATEEREEVEYETTATAAETAPNAVIYAASDFQWHKTVSGAEQDDRAKGETVMKNIIASMKDFGYENGTPLAVTHGLFLGDYSKRSRPYKTLYEADNDAGLKSVATVLGDETTGFGLTSNLDEITTLTDTRNAGDQVVYVQGNHDPIETDGLDASYGHDMGAFHVFVVHEEDFPWKQDGSLSDSGNDNDHKTAVNNTVIALERFFEERIAARDNRPVFVIAHLPLHYTRRTKDGDGDNMYADKIVDVLNRYGDQLTILYMFGHNHSDNYDDYLGGAAIYLPVGATMPVPLSSTTSFGNKTLKFTYLNSGYIGPYGGGCTTQQTSTAFEIYEDRIVVRRFGENGQANLKDAGTNAPSYLSNNTTVYTNDSAVGTIQMRNTFRLEMPDEALLATGKTSSVAIAGVAGKSYSVEWVSGDENIATVAADENDPLKATITAVNAGTVTITATITEVDTQTRALGDVTVKTMTVTVADTPVVTLATAGEHTFYVFTDHDENGNPEGNDWKADTSARYFFVSQDRGNPTAGRFMALHHNKQLDTAEGDIMGSDGAVWREVNAEPVNVMELPIEGDNLLVVDTANMSATDLSYTTWQFARATKAYSTASGADTNNRFSDSYNWYQIYPSHQSGVAIESRQCLMLTRGQQSGFNALTHDPDNDGLCMFQGSNFGWRMVNESTNTGLISNPHYGSVEDRKFAFYFDPIQADFTTYYIGSPDRQMGYRTYLYKETKITLTSDIVAYMADTNGAVSKGVGLDAGTGDVICISSGDEIVNVPVTLQMLSGTFDTATAGTYTGLTVTYAGKVITSNYTLTVNDAATLLKNHGGMFRSSIYRLVDQMIPGRHYMIVDSNEIGQAHALGANWRESYENDWTGVSAHNVLIQSFRVGGNNELFIDSTTYSGYPDDPVDYPLRENGYAWDINATPHTERYQRAVRLVWTPSVIQSTQNTNTNRYFTAIYGDQTRINNGYRFLVNELQDGRMWLDGDDDLVLYWGGSTSAEEEWKYSTTEGVYFASSVRSLYYNIEGHHNDKYEDKIFCMEDSSSGAPLFRRTWIYELTDDIDTITGRLDDSIGRVANGCNASAPTGDYILVETFKNDGTIELVKVPVTVSMLSKGATTSANCAVDTTTDGTYEGLTLTYQGEVITENYTLVVATSVDDNYPEFPDEGAVKIDKQLDTTQFDYLNTGAATIDLSVTGIPSQTGVDIVFILDTSSSMERCIHNVDQGASCGTCGTVAANESRQYLLQQTMTNTLKKLRQGVDGYEPDIDVAVATFNGYTPIDSLIMLDYEKASEWDKDVSSASDATQVDPDRMDSSNIALNFTDAAGLSDTDIQNVINKLSLGMGTNYDRGMEYAYNLLKAKQERDALNGETRQQIVIFMSDGMPLQLNYIMGTPWMIDWRYILQGKASIDAVPSNANANTLFNAYRNNGQTNWYDTSEGKWYENQSTTIMWLAEAIKGDPSQKYKIINPDLNTADKMEYVSGLGATIYTVGMGMAANKRITEDAAHAVLSGIASYDENGKRLYSDCTNATQFANAFDAITDTVRHAGNASFTDQMGEKFDLIYYNQKTVTKPDGTTATIDFGDPTITVKRYPLYYRYMIGETVDGVVVTENMVGTRRPIDPTVQETVTFNNDGTAAYSSAIGSSTNIMTAGVICAKTFFYNTTSEAVMIDHDGNADTAMISLDPECFYWKVGDIPQDELVLTYPVYLTGSMEGTRPGGTYDTNTYAKLNYTNHLGNACELSAESPKLPWNQATVGYGFYLVDKNGTPIINQTTGTTGSFERSVRVTKAVYQDFMLNSEGVSVEAATVLNMLPAGYLLFDQSAAYTVDLNSDGTGYYAIAAGRDDGLLTTFVQGISSVAVTGNSTVETTAFATSNTTVWFAVTANVQAVADTVVVDYGLPVEIDVMGNEVLIGNNGTLEYVGPTSTFGEIEGSLNEYLQNLDVSTTARFTTTSIDGAFGKAEVIKNTGDKNAKIRYTQTQMGMNKEETFVYAVNYTGQVGTQGYYYSTVTVIPATTIYYEDSFLTYTVRNNEDGSVITDEAVQWQAGEPDDGVQAEDRPGEFSKEGLDANNLYGYDGAYANMNMYSMGASHKVKVGQQMLSTGEEVETFATASFSFYGTGFDIVSVTSNKTGTIVVRVSGPTSETHLVDTYYGYKFENDQWVVDPDDTENALYQIPVIKVEDLTYGKYDVTISVYHAELFDHEQYDGKTYDFYLDAIRIYDPANDGAGNDVIQDAYVADKEGWPSYEELRNKLIAAGDFDALNDPDDSISGIVFIDNTLDADQNKVYTIGEYKNFGPNNEVYLAPGQGISFQLDAGSDKVAAIQLAMKSVNGATTAKVYDSQAEMADAVTDLQINTATEQYYDITKLNGRYAVVINTGSNILSLTNLKTTYSEDPNGTSTVKFVMSREIAATALASLDAPVELPPVTDDTTPDASELQLSMGHTVSLESDLQMNYRIKRENLEGYDLSTAYLVVEKDVYSNKGETDVERYTLYPDLSSDPDRVIFTLKGIQSVEMGSELRATLCVSDAQGREVRSDVDVYSVLAYVQTCFSSYSYEEDPALYRLLMDTLNYGAAAQVCFDRRPETLVNAGMEAYQQYASTEPATELTATKVVGEEPENALVSKMSFTLSFAERTEMNVKLKLTGAADQITAVKVTDAQGELLATLTDITRLSDGRLQVTYSDIKATQLRQMYYFTAYAGDAAVSATNGYSAEAYFAAFIDGGDALAQLCRMCVYYGDSAAYYFTQQKGANNQ